MSAKKSKICFISVDVEHDYGSQHRKSFKGVEGMREILDVLKKFKIYSTLFVTGEALERHEELLKKWRSGGHEIACHSYYHIYFDLLHAADIRNELEEFIDLYKRIFGKQPYGFRAPSHIISNTAMRMISDLGFCYDSSVVPHYPIFKKYRGYLGKAPKVPYFPDETYHKKEGDLNILEIPVTGHILGVPLAGAWLRGLPFWFYKFLFAFSAPRFISLSFHSWDARESADFPQKLYKILELLEKRGYKFKKGEDIFNEQILKNRRYIGVQEVI